MDLQSVPPQLTVGVVVVALAMGSLSITSASWVWYAKQVMGLGGVALTFSGVVLIGISVWGNVRMELGSYRLELGEISEALLKERGDAEKIIHATLDASPGLAKDLAIDLARRSPDTALPLVVLSAVGLKPREARALIDNLGKPADYEAQLTALLRRALIENLYATGYSDEALRLVDAALETRSGATELHDLRGRLLLSQNSLEEAEQAFARARELDPEHAPSLEGLALVAARRGEADRALDLVGEAIALEPQSTDLRYTQAQLQMQAGLHDEAQHALASIVEADPTDARAINDLAWLLAEEGELLDRALALAQRAVELRESATTLDTLGFVLLTRGEFEASEQYLEKALEYEDAPATRYRLGLALEAQGEYERAFEMLNPVAAGGFSGSEAPRHTLGRAALKPSELIFDSARGERWRLEEDTRDGPEFLATPQEDTFYWPEVPADD